MPPMQYEVHVVEDAALPAGQDWMVLEVDGQTHCVLRRSRLCPAILDEAWLGMGQRRWAWSAGPAQLLACLKSTTAGALS